MSESAMYGVRDHGHSAVLSETKQACAACQSERRVRMQDAFIGFCSDCLDRPRIVRGELGGEG